MALPFFVPCSPFEDALVAPLCFVLSCSSFLSFFLFFHFIQNALPLLFLLLLFSFFSVPFSLFPLSSPPSLTPPFRPDLSSSCIRVPPHPPPFLAQRSISVQRARHSGWLRKVGGNFRTWKRRFFVLQSNILFYFVDESVCVCMYVRARACLSPSFPRCFSLVPRSLSLCFSFFSLAQLQKLKGWIPIRGTIPCFHPPRSKELIFSLHTSTPDQRHRSYQLTAPDEAEVRGAPFFSSHFVLAFCSWLAL